MAKKITMQQVANELGLSRMTVSSVVNGLARERGVKKETATRIQQYLREHGYVPSRSARQLRGHDRPSVGILQTGSLYSHLIEAFNRISNLLIADHQSVEVVISPEEYRRLGVAELVAAGTPSLIWVQRNEPGGLRREMQELLPLLARFEQVILYNYFPLNDEINAGLDEIGAYRIIIDRAAATAKVAEFLYDLGHRGIAFPDATTDDLDDNHSRAPAPFLERGMRLYGCRKSGTPETEQKLETQSRYMAAKLAQRVRRKEVTAAWVYDDELAGFIISHLIRHEKIRIPQDLTFIGFDGMSFGGALAVPLTTMAIPVKVMTETVYRLLHSPEPQLCHYFQPELLLRESHGPAPAISPNNNAT